jgi:AcrR family transcriptional regulator
MASRPRDRRAQIITAAAAGFHRVGYHRVSTADIAAAVGITAGALYRHFRSKQELLAEIILDRVERLEAAFDSSADGSLADVTAALTRNGLDYRDLGVLWQRESRHLPGPERDKLRHRGRELGVRFARRIQQDRPDLDDTRAELLAWSVFAVVASPSHSTVDLPRPRFDEVLAAVADAVLTAPLVAGDGSPRPSLRGTLLAERASRREALLDGAVELFARDGYAQITMEEIGASVGMAGPSIYNHFAGKAEILDAAITRATQWLQFLLNQVLSTAGSPAEATRELVRGYAAFAVPHSELVEVLISETQYLPDDRRQATRRAQIDFVTDWVRLLRHDRPTADPTELRIAVLAELTIINNIARTAHLACDPDLVTNLESICAAVQRSLV